MPLQWHTQKGQPIEGIMNTLQEQAQAGREKLMAEMLEKGFMEVTTPLPRHTLQGQPIEAREATLWAVEAPTGELHRAIVIIAFASHYPHHFPHPISLSPSWAFQFLFYT